VEVAQDVPSILAESRRREKAQTQYYRALASVAESVGDGPVSERLNALHADEQHHLSRLTARLIELGETPEDLSTFPREEAAYEGWERVARHREWREIEWYEGIATAIDDPATRDVIMEILESERHHHHELGGKWMRA
jgi:rubrerythrin